MFPYRTLHPGQLANNHFLDLFWRLFLFTFLEFDGLILVAPFNVCSSLWLLRTEFFWFGDGKTGTCCAVLRGYCDWCCWWFVFKNNAIQFSDLFRNNTSHSYICKTSRIIRFGTQIIQLYSFLEVTSCLKTKISV